MSFDNHWDLSVRWPEPGEHAVYDLAHQLQTGIPHHPNHPPYSFSLTKRHGEVMYPEGVSAAAEMITTGGHVGTHMDGFAHVSKFGKIYGGFDVTENQSYAEGVSVQSVHEVSPVLAPGHLVDATVALGRDLTPEDGIGADLLDEWFSNHQAPEPGSVVLIRTGWDQHWTDNATFLGTQTGAPGVTPSGATWLTDHGIVASGTDTVAYEQQPAPTLPVHCHLLVVHGVPIMEAMNLAPIADRGVWGSSSWLHLCLFAAARVLLFVHWHSFRRGKAVTPMSSTEINRPMLGRPGPGEGGRHAVLAAAATVFARRGYLGTSIDAIADELGATKGRVYHYYHGKAEVFLDVAITGMHDIIAAIGPLSKQEGVRPSDRIYQMSHLHASFMMLRNDAQRVSVQAAEMRTVAEIAIHREVLAEVLELRHQYEQIFIEVIDEGIKLGDFAGIDSHLAVKSALGSLNWIPIWYARDRGSAEDIERVADSFARFIVNGLTGS